MKDKLDKTSSNKINKMRLIFMCMVVYIHAYNLEVYSLDGTIMSEVVFRLERISFYVNRIADPGFFALSGFLMFLGMDRTNIKEKLKRRVHSLIIPYFVWNFFYWIFWVIIGLVPSIHSILNDTTRGVISIQSFVLAFCTPIASQLWFLRNLIIVVLVAPALYYIMRNKLSGGVLCLLLLVVDILFGIGTYNILYTLLFFCIGGYLAFHGLDIVDRRYNLAIKIIGVVIWIASVLLSLFLPNISFGKAELIVQILLIASLWICLDCVINVEDGMISRFAKISFFVYCAHGLLLEGMEKVWLIIAGNNVIAALLDFSFMPIMVVIIVVLIAIFMKKHFTFCWKVLNGCR